ncbi:MAG: hypothetical protein Q9M28_12250 [Mariprofundaceae bacterium]|nr:hypothetical protein [Mariprofundaceae bacterium]
MKKRSTCRYSSGSPRPINTRNPSSCNVGLVQALHSITTADGGYISQSGKAILPDSPGLGIEPRIPQCIVFGCVAIPSKGGETIIRR